MSKKRLSPGNIEEFLSEARQFLDSRLPKRSTSEPLAAWGSGSDRIALLEEATRQQEEAALARARAWQADLFDAGYGWLTGPAELGGAELDDAAEAAFTALLGEYEVPDTRLLTVGLDIVAPAIATFGDPEQRRSWLPSLQRGDVVGCQLFSEPDAGSDLAAVHTSARPDGDDWLLTGQKVWTSGAHLADVGEALVRTDPEAPRHRGLTMFLVDMRAPGVEVRPIRQLTGGSSFNEVFLDGVRVPDRNRLGGLGEGWRVALKSLTSERSAMDDLGPLPVDFGPRLRQLVSTSPRREDPEVRRVAARAFASLELLRLTARRYSDAGEAAQGVNGQAGSVTKLLLVRCLADTATLLQEVLGAELTADTGAWGTHCWSELLLGIPAMSIAGGTDEIQRNLIAERALGLPR